MSELVTTRLPKESVETLEKLAEEEHTDKASLIRKMLLDHMEERLMQKAGDMYRRGEISAEEASVIANITIWKMLDYIRRNNIHPPEESLDFFEKNLEKARQTFKKKRRI